MADKKILVMVDMQYELTDRSSPLVGKMKKLLASGLFEVVIATKYIGVCGGSIETVLGYDGPEHDMIIPDLLPYVDDTVQKCTFCHFDAIKGVLQAHNTGCSIPRQVCVAGMDTDIGVFLTAMVLIDNGIRPVVLADYCWSSGGRKHHETGLKMLKRCIGENNIIYGVYENE